MKDQTWKELENEELILYMNTQKPLRADHLCKSQPKQKIIFTALHVCITRKLQ